MANITVTVAALKDITISGWNILIQRQIDIKKFSNTPELSVNKEEPQYVSAIVVAFLMCIIKISVQFLNKI